MEGIDSENEVVEAASMTISPIRTAAKANTSDKLETLGCPTDSHRSDFGDPELRLPSSPSTSQQDPSKMHLNLSKIQSCYTNNAALNGSKRRGNRKE